MDFAHSIQGGVPVRDLGIFNAANPDWMATGLEYIKKEYGSAEKYLTKAGKMKKADVARLRELMLA